MRSAVIALRRVCVCVCVWVCVCGCVCVCVRRDCFLVVEESAFLLTVPVVIYGLALCFCFVTFWAYRTAVMLVCLILCTV
jgi:hypothetical protein